MKKQKGPEKRLQSGRITCLTQRFLRLSMAWIAGMSLVILHAFLDARVSDPLGAVHRFLPITEYILAALLLMLGGALLIERSARERERDTRE